MNVMTQIHPFLDGKTKRMLIGGKWLEAASGKTFETRNPATGEILAHVAEGDAEDIDRAVAAAREAADDRCLIGLNRTQGPFMKFGIHNPSFVFGPDPADAFEGLKAKAQWAAPNSALTGSVAIRPAPAPSMPARCR
jgi:Aldehyde dehydrogenase family